MIHISTAAVDVGTGEITKIYIRSHHPDMNVLQRLEQCQMQAGAIDSAPSLTGLCGVIVARDDEAGVDWRLPEDFINVA
ncbi:hypothetical protein WG936_05380 [Corynebacterium sp. H127]|uniref:hypothetical protein n=1 Tax=Corynebacterium sp. H127 TaxID=3133418 RepID=UPI003096A0FA